VLARTRAKAWLARFVPAHLERTAYVWVASLLFMVVCVLWVPVAGVVWHLEAPAAFLGLALQVAGLAITLASALLLDVLDLGGVRQVLRARRGEPLEDESVAPAITSRGPFGWVRHPIYLGWLLMTFPAPTMTAGRLLFAAVSTFYLVVAIPWEERSLERQHGEAYRAYQRAVRWRMVPFVY
jgi:methanethiol S-methyltransferase